MRLKDKLAGCSHIEGVLRKATSNDPNPPKKESLSEMKSATCMLSSINIDRCEEIVLFLVTVALNSQD